MFPFVLEILKIIHNNTHTELPECFNMAEVTTLILQTVHIKMSDFVLSLGEKIF